MIVSGLYYFCRHRNLLISVHDKLLFSRFKYKRFSMATVGVSSLSKLLSGTYKGLKLKFY